MQNPDRFLTLHYCKQLTSANKRGAIPEIRDFERTFVKRLAKLEIPAYCASMMRTSAEQAHLYVTGESPDMPGHSAHELGQGCDILHSDYGMRLPKLCWQVLGHIGEEVAIQQGNGVLWGGILRPHHWEIL